MKTNSRAKIVTLRCSLSCVGFSEPPDIGNWFSSYEYKSPSLDSNVNFEDPAFKDCESEKDEEWEGEEEEVVVAEANLKSSRVRDEVVGGDKVLMSSARVKDDKHNAHLSLAKGLNSFSVPLSEPPDIRNWFSSYIYESPDSNTSGLFIDSASQETVCEEDNACFNVEDKNEHEVRLRCENVRPRESIFTLNTDSDTNTRVKPSSSMVLILNPSKCMSQNYLSNDTYRQFRPQKKMIHRYLNGYVVNTDLD